MNKEHYWAICLKCKGRGKQNKGIRKKVKLRYLRELEQFKKANSQGLAPVRPKGHLDACPNCKGSGLVRSLIKPIPFLESYKVPHTAPNSELATQVAAESENTSYPHLAIIGGGIGGVALAVACLHRGIPFTLYERDSGFNTRSQGYGLTLQQASKAIEGLGVFSLPQGVISTRHVVHTTDGKEIGNWGIRNLESSDVKTAPKRTNIHIARQSLRLALLEQLGGESQVQWGHQLIDFKDGVDGVDLSFQVESKDGTKSEIIHAKADLVVGADGIRSAVRRLLIGEELSPLRYLGCIVILGICPLQDIVGVDRSLLDSQTVFQTANGNERIYIMPYDANSVMWQLSFPMPEQEAKALSAKGVQALKEEAIQRCQWHDPIPQILAATQITKVSGYPVYDRALLVPELLKKGAKVTLIGDAAHPMSPFKGQGANQALLDALALARGITTGCRPLSYWRRAGVRDSVLTDFEAQMLERSAKKVKESAHAAMFLHTDVVLHEGNEPRGRVLQRKKEEE